MNKTDQRILETVADLHEIPQGAYNIRRNGEGAGRRSTENIIITTKEDKPGIDIVVKPFTKNESVHIPVILTESGLNDMVYNDFEIGEGADVLIVAGCGIHNSGSEKSEHDGVHTFHIGKGAKVRYVEKHYGEGSGTGERVLNPVTVVYMQEDSYCEMELVQIKGVDSTKRDTTAHLEKNAKMVMIEKLMTHEEQFAESNMDIYLDGEDSVVQIISRSVAKNSSKQIFHPKAIGNTRCRAHVQCDSIIMDHAQISSIPEIAANHADAQIVHEAAIGRINNDQLVKLQTFGMTDVEAEEVIIEGFLK